MALRVLGIDPGSYKMGYGVVDDGEKTTAIAFGVVAARTRLPVDSRLYFIYNAAVDLLDRWQPHEVAIEDPFVGKNLRSILALGQAQGVVLLAAAQRKLPVARYSPALIKRIVADFGTATKEQMELMVRLALRLDAPIKPFDAADALGIALCHLSERRAAQTLAREARLGA